MKKLTISALLIAIAFTSCKTTNYERKNYLIVGSVKQGRNGLIIRPINEYTGRIKSVAYIIRNGYNIDNCQTVNKGDTIYYGWYTKHCKK